jgi:hypothetical protein
MENTTAPLQVGRESTAWRMFNGGMDELRVWSVARSAAAIQSTTNAALSGSEAGLVGYWRLNDGSGATSVDSSMGSRAISLFNGPAWTAGPGAPVP